ncbi:ParB/RepB/Spo0J family partition protein, partial [Cohaesibacter celericrescens]
MSKKSEIKSIPTFPLSKLVLSDINPRQIVDETEVEALAQSIKACGLIQNLVGISEGENIGIVAGGRRLRALQLLLETKEIIASFPVAVRVAENEEQALEWANAENTARKDLNPSEEIKAYRIMQEKGFSVEKIAIAFAKTVRHVKGRLRLANLAECILDALAQGDVTLDIASVYTITDDQEKQTETFNRLNGSWGGDQEHTIKNSLMAEANTADDRRTQFVGREAYEAAGGKIREDLFGEDVYFLDTIILDRLVDEKLEQVRQDVLAKGWKWIQANVDLVPYQERELNTFIQPTRPELNDQQSARLEALKQADRNDQAKPNELKELQALLDYTKPVYLSVDMDFAGGYVSIGHDGQPRLDLGYI